MPYTIGAVGDLTVDVIIPGLSRIPEWGQEIEVGEPMMRLGGNIGNMAVGASALGCDFKIFSIVGKDEEGGFILERLQELKLDVAKIDITDQKKTCKTYACLREDGERFMLTSKGTLACMEEMVLRDDFGRIDVLFIGGWCLPPRVEAEKLNQCMAQWKREGRILAADLIWSDETWQQKNLLANFLNKIDILLMNESELYALTGTGQFEQAICRLRKMTGIGEEENGHICIIKLGAQGAALLEEGGLFKAKAYPVKPVDTVGAGDLFNIGFLHAMFHLEMDTKQSLAFASTFASLFISRYDKSPPAQQEVLRLMEQGWKGCCERADSD